MNFEQFTSDLPSDRAVRFRFAEENEETMRRQGVTQEMRQLGGGGFQCEMATNETEKIAFFADRFSKACTMYLAPPKDTIGIVVPRTLNGDFCASGENLGSEKLVVIFERSGCDIVVPDLFGSECLLVAQARFTELLNILCPSMEKPERTTVYGGDAEKLALLRDEVLSLASSRASELPEEQSENVLASVIGWMTRHAGTCEKERSKCALTRCRIARRARDYIEDSYRGALRIEDLCSVTGAGTRSLQTYFKDYFGITVSRYIKTVRLDAARRELAAERPERTTVTKVALRNGFTHFGRFSVEFRERFGESPRKTLASRTERHIRTG